MTNPHTWRFDGNVVTQNRNAAIQTGVRQDAIQAVLDQYPYRHRHGLMIFELESDLWGIDPVAEVEVGTQVRYSIDLTSKAKPENRPMAPFILVDEMPTSNVLSVYVIWIKGQGLQLVRAHHGSPYPPLPTTSSAQSWPGYPSQGMSPGRHGCRLFWRRNALVTTDARQFHKMRPVRPRNLR